MYHLAAYADKRDYQLQPLKKRHAAIQPLVNTTIPPIF